MAVVASECTLINSCSFVIHRRTGVCLILKALKLIKAFTFILRMVKSSVKEVDAEWDPDQSNSPEPI